MYKKMAHLKVRHTLSKAPLLITFNAECLPLSS